MRKWLILTGLILFAAAPFYAQQRLNIDVPGLADKAAETTDVTLDGSMLRLAAKFLNDSDDHDAREIIKGLQGIYVRSYEFDKEGEYDRDIVAKIRAQLGPSWKKMVQVKSRNRENTEIYVDMRGDTPNGLLVISAEPKELTIVNLVGFIDIDKLSSIEGSFGIPRITEHGKAKDKEKAKEKAKDKEKDKEKENDDE
jgi:Domain of unknown function (DUF4252)